MLFKEFKDTPFVIVPFSLGQKMLSGLTEVLESHRREIPDKFHRDIHHLASRVVRAASVLVIVMIIDLVTKPYRVWWIVGSCCMSINMRNLYPRI